MSAFLVSRTHIDVLVAARVFARPYSMHGTASDLGDTDLGRMLWRENMLSLASRYSDQPVDETALATYVHRVPPIAWLGQSAIVAILKAIHCYRYQACEHEAWESSDAAAYTAELESFLICKLPGYDKAPWGIENIHDDSRRALPEVDAQAPVLTPSMCQPLAPFPVASTVSTLPAPPSANGNGSRHLTVSDACGLIRAALRKLTDRAWSVSHGRGTAYGWITVHAPPRCRTPEGYMLEADQQALGSLFDEHGPAHCQGLSISPESRAHYVDVIQRKAGAK